MAGQYFPTKDADFANWLATFLTNATANTTALGLVSGDLTPISALQTTLMCHSERSEESSPAANTGFFTSFRMTANSNVILNGAQRSEESEVCSRKRFFTSFRMTANSNVILNGAQRSEESEVCSRKRFFTSFRMTANSNVILNGAQRSEESEVCSRKRFFTSFGLTRKTPALKALIGITTGQGGGYPVHPVPPSDLVADILPDGTIELDWSRNGKNSLNQDLQNFRINRIKEEILIYSVNSLILKILIQIMLKARKNNETSGPSNIAVAGVPIPVVSPV